MVSIKQLHDAVSDLNMAQRKLIEAQLKAGAATKDLSRTMKVLFDIIVLLEKNWE